MSQASPPAEGVERRRPAIALEAPWQQAAAAHGESTCPPIADHRAVGQRVDVSLSIVDRAWTAGPDASLSRCSLASISGTFGLAIAERLADSSAANSFAFSRRQ